MAGHSHSANIKHRKDRQDIARSQLFLKLRKKIENILKEEGKITDKVLSIARENKFPKEKIYQIYEKLNKEENNPFQRMLFQAPFSILIYLESSDKIDEKLIKKLKLKMVPISSLTNYFQEIHFLKLNFSGKLEEYLIDLLSSPIWENLNYQEKSMKLISSKKETINSFKKEIKKEGKIQINEEGSIWKPLFYCKLTSSEEKKYYYELKESFKIRKIFTNVKEE